MAISTERLDRLFQTKSASQVMEYIFGEREAIQTAGLVDYIKNMTPGLWQSIGPSIEALTPLLTREESDRLDNLGQHPDEPEVA